MSKTTTPETHRSTTQLEVGSLDIQPSPIKDYGSVYETTSNSSEVKEETTPILINNQKTVAELALAFEQELYALEHILNNPEEYYQTWLKNNDSRLRNMAARDHRIELQGANEKVSRLESELASAYSGLTRRSAAVRHKLI